MINAERPELASAVARLPKEGIERSRTLEVLTERLLHHDPAAGGRLTLHNAPSVGANRLGGSASLSRRRLLVLLQKDCSTRRPTLSAS